jgi:hypothetical protein
LYHKYYGSLGSLMIRLLIYIFGSLRIIAFLLIGKGEYSKTYAKVLATL